MGDSFFTYLSSAMVRLFTANAGYFEGVGARIYLSLAVLALIREGLCYLYPDNFGPPRIVRRMILLVVTGAMLRYYSAPLPGLSYGFYKIFSNEADQLSARLEGGTDQAVQERLNEVYVKMEAPGVNFRAMGSWLYYFAVIILLAMMRFALVAIISVGFMAVGLGALFGPLFIPWLALDETAWVFKSWLRSYIGYCFYQVAAAGTVFIAGGFLVSFFNDNPPPYTLGKLAVIFLELVVFIMAAMFAMLRVPSMAASYLSGRSGESGFKI